MSESTQFKDLIGAAGGDGLEEFQELWRQAPRGMLAGEGIGNRLVLGEETSAGTAERP